MNAVVLSRVDDSSVGQQEGAENICYDILVLLFRLLKTNLQNTNSEYKLQYKFADPRPFHFAWSNDESELQVSGVHRPPATKETVPSTVRRVPSDFRMP